MADVKITDNSTIVKQAMDIALHRALIDIGKAAEGHAVDNMNKDMPHADGESRPYIDTGTLWNSIHNAVQGKQVQIGTNVEYAIYIHEGTRYITPNRFLRDAVADWEDDYRQMVINELQRTTL